MTPGARYNATIELWGFITGNARVPMDTVCGDYFRSRRYIGSKDRSDIAERIYNIMRANARLTWWRDELGLDKTARSHVLLCAKLIDKINVEELFSGEKYHPEILTDIEKEKLKNCNELNDLKISADVLNECPEWAYDRLKNVFGDDFENEMQAMLNPATLDIRVNTLKATRDEVQSLLASDKIKTEKSPYSPVGLRLKSKAYLAHSKAFKKGMIEIQDEGSQLLALICNPQPGHQVLDYCAGGGGKTLALAAAMNGKGRIIAMDLHADRLAKAKPRLTKADVHNVELRAIGEDKHRKWLRRQKEKFDVVLVDAPCSSSGTWRRNPDLRWHHFGPSHEEIQESQSYILNHVWDKVKIGGRLIYATCSLFNEENEDQISAFLSSHSNFKIIPVADAWAQAGLDKPCPCDGDFLRLSPYKNKTDGFFAAILERTA